jgi:DNA (cytosine-5)-methyltransferase 1
MSHKTDKTLKAVDFFCSGGGMTYGLSQAGVKVLGGIDIDIACKETYEINNPSSRFILADAFELKEKELQNILGLKENDDNLILVGCSPCQYWSIIRTDKTKSSKSKNLLLEFKRFVDYFRPGYVLVENVPGILTHKKTSGLECFVTSLENNGYKVHYDIVNMNDYGIPQSRRRFSLLATRLQDKPIFPVADKKCKPTVREFLGITKGFIKINHGHRDSTEFNHSTARLIDKNVKRLKKTPHNGGSWLDWANDKELKRLHYQGNGFVDNYGRISWDKPAPTITTKFISISNGRFAHPEEDRGLSIREGATLQTFPKDYKFPAKSLNVSAKIIGNAVPPLFAKGLAETIIKAHNHE